MILGDARLHGDLRATGDPPHPRVQADLADVQIEASTLNGVQFIVESHSEHFLRRLQRRVAQETITKDHVALYGVTVEFLCPSEVKATYEKKFGDARHD